MGKNPIESPIFIRTEHDTLSIRGRTERLFAMLIVGKGMTIIYEPKMFTAHIDNGNKKGTLPDFYIENPNNPHAGGIYVEITTSPNNGTDPKARQREVMQKAAPGERYVVLYDSHLQSIQKAHPGVNFFEQQVNGKPRKNNH